MVLATYHFIVYQIKQHKQDSLFIAYVAHGAYIRTYDYFSMRCTNQNLVIQVAVHDK